MTFNKEDVLPFIAKLTSQVDADEAKTARDKETVNRLCEMIGIEPRYPVAGSNTAPSMPAQAFFYHGLSIGAAAERFLVSKKVAGGSPVGHPREIHSALEQGGIEFKTKSLENAITSIRSALQRLPNIFVRLESGEYQLLEAAQGGATEPQSHQAVTEKPRAKGRLRRAFKRGGKAPTKKPANKALAAFIVDLLAAGDRDSLSIKQAAVQRGGLGIEAGTPVSSIQGTMLALHRAGRVASLGAGKWAAKRSDQPVSGSTNIHPLKSFAS